MNSLDFDRRTLLMLVGVLLAAVAATAFFTRRPPAVQPMTAPLVSLAPSVSPTPSTSGSPADDVVVEVVGKVRSPKVLHLPKGARVIDALEEAGGARPGVDTSDQNLARVLVDGEQIRIGLDPAPPTGTTAGTSPGLGALIDINTAPAEVLEQIPGVGPVLAQRIIAFRDLNGGFQSVDQLTEVSGIGDATFAEIQPLVTIGNGG